MKKENHDFNRDGPLLQMRSVFFFNGNHSNILKKQHNGEKERRAVPVYDKENIASNSGRNDSCSSERPSWT